MPENLKHQTFSGFICMFMERIGAQAVTFVVSLVLARIFLPDDYGIVALTQIFVNFASIFVIQGLNASLIQRDEAEGLEFSTAFIANLILSLVLYAILFITLPFLAEYYTLLFV